MSRFINLELMRHPVNWIIIYLMVLLAVKGIALIATPAQN